jgi:3-deoxy-D-manno-octulosonate 8-phosphate phosphatase (KDO 8-P phosphatase)
MKESIKNIKIIIMDVDGVLTDGRIILDDDGREYKFFDVKDGHIIHIAIDLGIKIAWISGRYSSVTQKRAKQLKIKDVFQGQHKKLDALKTIKEKYDVDYKNIAYIGDDLIDIPPMLLCGFSASPNDAVLDVQRVADYVSKYDGGRGAIRDTLELILKEKGLWEGVLEKYLLNSTDDNI